MIRRRTAICPVVASLVSICIAVILLASGTAPGNGKDNYWLSVNTSRVGHQIVQLTPGSNTGTIEGIFEDDTSRSLVNITAAVDDGVQDIQGQVVSNLVQKLGVKDTYKLYLTKACEGDYENPDDPHSGSAMKRCVDYEDRKHGLRNISSSMPSYFILGNTNISVPLVVAMGSTVESLLSLATQGAHAMLVLIIIGTASVGIALFGSVVTAVQGFRCPVVWINMCFAILGATALLIFAATATAIVVGGASAVDRMGTAWDIKTARGGPFLTMAWISACFSLVGSSYWFAVWFVEFRGMALIRKARNVDEIGNWKGILSELGRDMRVHVEKTEGSTGSIHGSQ